MHIAELFEFELKRLKTKQSKRNVQCAQIALKQCKWRSHRHICTYSYIWNHTQIHILLGLKPAFLLSSFILLNAVVVVYSIA